jgi:hypothetical protein
LALTSISKHFAYCTPETGAQLHRQRGFRVKMNGNPEYPQIIEVHEEVPLPKSAPDGARAQPMLRRLENAKENGDQDVMIVIVIVIDVSPSTSLWW